jgi:hypothetical protein
MPNTGSLPPTTEYLNPFPVCIPLCLLRFTERSFIKPFTLYSMLYSTAPFLNSTGESWVVNTGSETVAIPRLFLRKKKVFASMFLCFD